MKNKQPSLELKEIIETLSMYYEDFLEENATCGGCSYWGMPKVIELSNRLALSSEIDQAIAEERERVVGILSDENYKLEEWYSSSERPDTLTHFEANQRNMENRNKIQDLLYPLDKPLTNK